MRADAFAVPPDRDIVAAAYAAAWPRVEACIRRARGEDVPVPHVDPFADAVIAADARARGVDLDDPRHVARARAALVDRLVALLAAEERP